MSDQTQGPDAPPFEDTPLKQAIRCAFDHPTVVNIEAVAAAALLPQPAERPHQWTRRQGREAVYDCPVCGMWTANLPLYKNDPCEKAIAPTPAPTYRVEQIAEALRAVKIVIGVTSEGELRAYRQPRQRGR